MDSTDLYGICIGSIVIFLVLFSFCHSLLRIIFKYARRFFLRQLYFSLLPQFLGGYLRLSRYNGILVLLYISSNICLLLIGVNDHSDFIRRLGRAALINLVPLCAGGRFNPIAHILAIQPDNYLLIHKCVGIAFIIEASLHSILSWNLGDVDLGRWPDRAGLIAASSSGALALTSIPIIWRWMYESSSTLHLALVATGIISLWFHLNSTSIIHTPRLYLVLAISTFVFVKILRFLSILFINISKESFTTASVQQIGHGIEIQVSMPRPLKYRAGQFVFLSIPRLAAFQSHPFQVAWEYLNESGRQVIVFVIQPRHGFTGRLRLATPLKSYLAFLEGPYGSPIALDQYGTVLLFATGIGIAGQLHYMKEQLHLYREWRTNTRRHVLFWEMDAEEYRYWVNEWINEVLSWNIDYDIQLYIRGQFLAKDAQKGISVNKGESLLRLTLNYFSMEPENLIHSEIQRCEGRGRMLVSLCTDPSTARRVTEVVRPLLGDDLDLVELDFRPWPGSRHSEESIPEVYKQGRDERV